MNCPRVSQRGPGLQAHIGAGEPPPAGQRLSRRGPQTGICLPRIHLPQTQVLGEERGGGAQRCHHTGAAQVSVQWGFESFEKSTALPLKVAAAKFIGGDEDQTHHAELSDEAECDLFLRGVTRVWPLIYS